MHFGLSVISFAVTSPAVFALVWQSYTMSSVEPSALLPIVRWAQRKETISLKVELQECLKPNISIKPESIHFEAQAVGAKGKNLYGFSLQFFEDIDDESVVHKLTGSSIEIFFTKQGSGKWWPRLTKEKAPHFLKLDFDKWKSESDDEDERQKIYEENFMEDLKKEYQRHKDTVDALRKGYLIIYNMVQFLAHLYIFLFCTINFFRGGYKVLPFTYNRCGNAVHLAVTLSFMEVVHPLCGIMKGSWTTPLMQSSGRQFAMFCLWLASDYIKTEWYVTALFTTWSTIELVRYPLYICQLGNMTSKPLTWLRYNMWIPLYPLGVLLETILYIRASQSFTENELYELRLPNSFNFVVKFTWLIRLYLAVFLYLFATVMIPHMWKMRRQKFEGKKKYKQP